MTHDEVRGVADATRTEFTMPALPERLEDARDRVASFLMDHVVPSNPGFPSEDTMLAVQEALTNVVRHAYVNAPEPGRMGVGIELDAECLRLRVLDWGCGFDPDAIPAPDFAEPTPGGYGVQLMRDIMTRVEYRRAESGNEMVLERRLRGSEEPSS